MLKSIFSIQLLCSLLLFDLPYVFGQVKELPYQENFEKDFSLSPSGCVKEECVIEFITNWRSPEVKKSSRVFRDTISNSGDYAMAFIPIATTSPEVSLLVENATRGALTVNLYAATAKNGKEEDTRSSLMKLSVSFDNGKTFIQETVVDTFRNEFFGNFKRYTVAFDMGENLSDQLLLKIQVKRLTPGTGLAAKVLVDDVDIDISPVSGVKKYNSSGIQIVKNDPSFVHLNKAVTGKVYNLLDGREFIFNESAIISKSVYGSGVFLLITESGDRLKVFLN